MQTVQVSLADRPYPIHIGPHLMGSADALKPFISGTTVAVVTNETLAPLFLKRVSDSARALGKQVVEIILPDGEAFKTAESLDTIYSVMLAAKCDRKTTILALGGGAVGLAGSIGRSSAPRATASTEAVMSSFLFMGVTCWTGEGSTPVPRSCSLPPWRLPAFS